MSRSRRVQLQPAFLLHHRPYRDTSRIVDFFTRDHGRVTLFARAVRGSRNRYAALLQPFVPLLVSWSGSGDGGTLSGAEPAPETSDARSAPPPAARLMSGFYLNELCLRLLAREDPHPELYECYAQAVAGLAAEEEARVLRLFEKRLLDGLGFGIDYAHVFGSGERVDADAYYDVPAERGVVPRGSRSPTAECYRGADLLALAAESLEEGTALAAARRLLGQALAHALDGQELSSRAVARAMASARLRPLTKESS